MPINKATLIKESPTDGSIHYIYPKTTADLVLYNNGKTIQDKIDELESSITTGELVMEGYVKSSDSTYANMVQTVNELNNYVTTMKNYYENNGGYQRDSALDSTSISAVQNRAIYAALSNKVDKDGNKVLSTNDFTTAYKTQLDGYKDKVPILGNDGKIPASYIPGSVDKILEGYFNSDHTVFYKTNSTDGNGNYNDPYYTNGQEGEGNKLYVDLTNDLIYRHSGIRYREVSSSIALGETSSTAYSGDKGAQLRTDLNSHTNNRSNPHNVTAEQVGLSDTVLNNKIENKVTKNYIISKLELSEGESVGGSTYSEATIYSAGLMAANDKKALKGLHDIYNGSSTLISATDSQGNSIIDPSTAATIHGDLLYNGNMCAASLNLEMKKDCRELIIYFSNMGSATIFDATANEVILDSGYTFYDINLQSGFDVNEDGTIDDNETEYQTVSAACPYVVKTYNFVNTEQPNRTGNCIKITSDDNALFTGAIIKVSFTTKLYNGSTTSIEI